MYFNFKFFFSIPILFIYLLIKIKIGHQLKDKILENFKLKPVLFEVSFESKFATPLYCYTNYESHSTIGEWIEF